jgi:CelD/BcsL family acetyltransferase involved in cellulose biosynthesis
VFAAELLPPDPAWHALGARLAARAAAPVLRFDGLDWDGYLATRSRNFRQLLRRRERRADEAGAAFRLADAETLDRDLDTLFALHRERWGDGSGFGRHEAFHRAFARAALDCGWLRLWLLELDGAPAAAWYGFRFEGAESYYQAGRARRFDALAPGLVLLAHTVREAQRDGMEEYRFLRGDEAFKFRFADEDDGLLTLVRARGPLGTPALAGLLAGRRLWAAVRR